MYLLPLLINLICLQNKSGHLFQEKKNTDIKLLNSSASFKYIKPAIGIFLFYLFLLFVLSPSFSYGTGTCGCGCQNRGRGESVSFLMSPALITLASLA